MGGAASKDFLDSGPKTAGAKELDELGGEFLRRFRAFIKAV